MPWTYQRSSGACTALNYIIKRHLIHRCLRAYGYSLALYVANSRYLGIVWRLCVGVCLSIRVLTLYFRNNIIDAPRDFVNEKNAPRFKIGYKTLCPRLWKHYSFIRVPERRWSTVAQTHVKNIVLRRNVRYDSSPRVNNICFCCSEFDGTYDMRIHAISRLDFQCLSSALTL